MTADFLEYFYTTEYDDKVILKSGGKTYTVKDIKTLILNKPVKPELLAELNCFDFVVEILARIFSLKDIYFDEQQTAKVKEFCPINPKEILIHFKTSGSSGTQKEIVKSLENLISEAKDIQSQFPQIQGLEFISTTTMNHLFGFTFHLMTALNSKSIINSDIVSIPENINIKNACLISTPSFIETMLKYQNSPVIMPKMIITAGAKLKNNVFEYAKNISDEVVEIYGSTETGVIAYRQDSKVPFNLFPNTKIHTNEQTEVETIYSLNSPVTIGDKINILNEKQIQILGRTDRIYKIQEKRICATDIENKLKTHSFIDDAYITKHSDKLASLCILTANGLEYLYNNGMTELTKELKAYLKSDIIPQKWKFTDEIPKTQTGKTDVKSIEEIFNLNLSLPVICEKSLSENKAEIKLYFYRNCNFFKGHFDGFPLVPGVVQLFYAQYFAKKIFKIDCVSGQYRKIKFTNIIQPDKLITLELEQQTNGINYKYKDENSGYSSGLLPIKSFDEVSK